MLVLQHGGTGPCIGRAVALAEAGQIEAAVAVLDELPAAAVASHQPYWVARAHLLRSAGRVNEAAAATRRAAGLTADERVRRFLLNSLPE